MAAGDATAADVPGKYDIVINGKGYVLLDSLESSIPFRTHRAIYGQTQPFVERQNVSNTYGDNAQDFFQQIRQRDWSLGEQQKFFRAGQDGRYWMGQGIDNTTPGQIKLSPQVGTATFAGAVKGATRNPTSHDIITATSTNLYSIATDGTITDLGAHGLGTTPSRYAICNDGKSVYLSSTSAGSVGIRKWNGSTFSTFSASTADSLAFVNNTLYGADLASFAYWDTGGVATVPFVWKGADGTNPGATQVPRLHPYGGKVLIAFPYAQESSELWIYDGTGVSRLEVLPENFIVGDIEVLYGIVYIAGSYIKPASTTTNYLKPAILFWDGSQIGKLWEANDFNTSTVTTSNLVVGPHPALGVSGGQVIFTDETTGNLMSYNPALGGVHAIGTFTPNSGDSAVMASTGRLTLHVRNQTTGYYFPASTYPSSGYVISSLIDFDSSLTKVFRGVTIEYAAASDGNGGTIDVAYQLNGLTGSWTSLATGVTSGTEVDFPAAISGHSIALKVTLNKGTSTSGPTLKSMSVRGAPVMPIYSRGEYILDCTNTEDAPRTLRDGSYHPLTGYDQVLNLVAARNSQVPISFTDKVNGTYTGFVDVNDPQGFDVYEIHPAEDDLKKAGSYVVRLTARGV